MIQRLVKLTFQADKTDAFEQIFTESKAKILARPGCLHLEGWRDVHQTNCYYTYSRWHSEEHLNDYRHSDYFKGVWAATKALFADRPQAFSAEKLTELRPPSAEVTQLPLDDYHLDFGPVGQGHFDWLAARNYGGWVVIVDSMTRQHCLPRVQSLLTGHPHVVIEVPPGEQHKHLDTCRLIWEDMFRAGVGRRWCVLNLGGGVVGDMGGFAAATYKRGIDFVQIPTTLLSQVDASVGGKLGIDFFDVKNSIGVFRNPQAVWIDPAFLATLPAREIRSGYAEVIKHALIADAGQWKELRQLTDLKQADWTSIIPHSVGIKREIVLQDPLEKGRRKALNFGHTIGHAIESHWLNGDDPLLHGEAIGAGMIMEAWLSVQHAGLPAGELEAITDYLLSVYGHRPIPTAIYNDLLKLMRQDKKNDDHRINFTLLNRIGSAMVNRTAEEKDIQAALDYYNGLA